ncbi:hypothetical protein HNQ59_001283 [Chitinivorax tropicus]|uniref:DUF4124 domain-containing protein n=1 Tax=Chitinivorax tropicus TaxID=714531 RepID=A0A840MH72_9PROT|nr:DUF4124 domain-containing protein [Chitinivorax tropicus]MBB5017998.1 hypothetical protein [Chitinivorax tropicus]
MRKLISAGILFALVASVASAGNTYKWVDENGKVHYSDQPPLPQDTKSKPAELNRGGVVVRNPERQKAEQEAKVSQQSEEQRLKEQRRRDNALLKTYTKPEEVDLVRDRALEGIDAEIKASQLGRKAVEERLSKKAKQVANLKGRNKPIPQDLQDDIQHDQDEMKRIDDLVKTREQDKIVVRQKSEADKARLIELLSGKKN